MLAFIPGYRRHRRWPVVLLGLIGLGLLSAGVLVPGGGLSEGAETGLTVLGGTLLIAAHLRNGYLCRLCPACGGAPCVENIAECSAG
jgi:peptidoglycan/LPS O-acetylase OafA/YrhL